MLKKGGELKMSNVSAAMRTVGSGFFQEYTGVRRDTGQRTYDHTACTAEDESEGDNEVFYTHDDVLEDDILETLAAENDEDAIMVVQFEDSISETNQNDSELSPFYSTYQDARRRLNERVKVRGFWPVQRRGETGKSKGKVKGKGKGTFSGPGALARRIANSFCSICLQKGHWKNECPQRANQSAGAQSNSASSLAPTSFVVVEDVPTEIAHMALAEEQDTRSRKQGYNWGYGDNKRGKWDKKGFMSIVSSWSMPSGSRCLLNRAKSSQEVADSWTMLSMPARWNLQKFQSHVMRCLPPRDPSELLI